MRDLVICIGGIPGAGKSAFAKQLIEAIGWPCRILEADDFADWTDESRVGSEWKSARIRLHRAIRQELSSMMETRSVKEGLRIFIVVDTMHRRSMRLRMARLVKRYGIHMLSVIVCVEPWVALSRRTSVPIESHLRIIAVMASEFPHCVDEWSATSGGVREADAILVDGERVQLASREIALDIRSRNFLPQQFLPETAGIFEVPNLKSDSRIRATSDSRIRATLQRFELELRRESGRHIRAWIREGVCGEEMERRKVEARRLKEKSRKLLEDSSESLEDAIAKFRGSLESFVKLNENSDHFDSGGNTD